MRYIVEAGRKQPVDSDESCPDQHGKRNPPLYHIVQNATHTPFVVRCPKSLSNEERKKLKGGNDGDTKTGR